jgi:hypothetical protein
MKRLLKLVAAAVPLLAMAAVSYGATITYSTLGRFNGGAFSSSPTLTVGGGSITFNSLGSSSVDPGNISYGAFDSNAIGSGGTIPVGTTFDLQVNQTTPSVGSAIASATLSGTLTTTSSSVRLLFATTAFTIGGVQYVIDQPANGIAIVSPASNGGRTTIQGSVSLINVVPEPTTYLLLGSGLCLVTMISRKRSRA